MKSIRNLPLGFILFAGSAIVGMEPAPKELPIARKHKDKEKKSHDQAQIFADSYNEVAKLDERRIHDPKVLNTIVEQRHQEVLAQLKIIETIQKTRDHAEYFYQNKPRIKLLREQFTKYQESIDALTKANAQLIAYHKLCLEENRKNLKAHIVNSKESEKNKQEFEKQCAERQLKEEQEREKEAKKLAAIRTPYTIPDTRYDHLTPCPSGDEIV